MLLLCAGRDTYGMSYAQVTEERFGDWRRPAEYGWTLCDLPAALADVGTVVWLLLDEPGRPTGRDSEEGAALALLAGFALARGRDLIVLRENEARPIADVAHIEQVIADEEAMLAALEAEFAAAATPVPVSPTEAWRHHMAKLHGRRLVPFFGERGERILEDVYVEVDVELDVDLDHDAGLRAGGACTLGALMQRPDDAGQVRWLVLGEPGAGKTTLARHLAHALAEDTAGALPISVTVAEYCAFDPDRDCLGGDTLPVTLVDWYRAALFAAWHELALPTEAQWEYACRGGNPGRWCFGDDKSLFREYGNVDSEVQAVGQHRPNAHGLHDMHGNIMEWCAGWHGAYPDHAETDPKGPPTGVGRVLRGGTAWNGVDRCRSAYRVGGRPSSRDGGRGFRLARPPES